MNPYCYYNGAGQCFPLPERPLEPPDCREEEAYGMGEDEGVDHKNQHRRDVP